MEDEIFEITTYRIEGEYKDHRRPDKVDFTDRLEEDLKRRDFTINAMAYNEKKGLIDLFGGKEDLNNKIIKTVGNPYDRFNEDGLRMIRAIRFSSKLNFTIEKETLKAIYDKSFIINNISLERITDEFTKIILSDKPENIRYLFETKLLKYLNISNEDNIDKLTQFYNEIIILNKINKNLEKRLALLDYIIEKNNINCKSFCNELIYSKKVIKNHNIILTLLKNIEIDHLNKVEIKKILSEVDRNLLEEYLDISGIIYDKEKKVDEIIDILSEIEENNECYIIKNLKVNGRDIMSLGYKNKEVGEVLNYLLEIVIEDYTLNKKDVLIKKIKEI